MTERLIMRRWRDADRGPFAAMNADPEVMRWFPAPLTREQSDAFVDRMEAGLEREDWGLWALELRATGEFIGFTGLQRVPFQAFFTPAIEVGWRLARPFWGYGYASEAARHAITFVDEVVSFTAVQNDRSRAVMERIGLSLVGEFEHPRLAEDSPIRRHVLYRRRATAG